MTLLRDFLQHNPPRWPMMTLETSKAVHGIIALFDATMILFQPVIEVFMLPM
jgi:hypothetical protein